MLTGHSHSSPASVVKPLGPSAHRLHLGNTRIRLGRSPHAEAARPDVCSILDRLCQRPAEQIDDAKIRACLRRSFGQDLILAGLAIDEVGRGERRAIAHPGIARGALYYDVADGLVTLTGAVPDFVTRAWAELLVWWVPGVRNVINKIALQHAEQEKGSPDKIAETIDLAIANDPDIDEAQIRVRTSRGTLVLTGRLPCVEQRRKAEAYAWCIPGIDDVVNEIEVDG